LRTDLILIFFSIPGLVWSVCCIYEARSYRFWSRASDTTAQLYCQLKVN